MRFGNMAGERTGHETWRPDLHGGAPGCNNEIALEAPDVRAGFGIARPSPTCDDGIKGPLTELQTDGSPRTPLGARNGLQRAAHLELLPLFLLGSSVYPRHRLSLENQVCTHELSESGAQNRQPKYDDAPPSCAPAWAAAVHECATCQAPCPASRTIRVASGHAPPNLKAAARRASLCGTGNLRSPRDPALVKFGLDGPRKPHLPGGSRLRTAGP